MSRIRTIKPTFWTSAQVMDCRPITRLFFIGLWNFCDDAGRHPCNAKQLRALIFPGDDLSVDVVGGMLNELMRMGLIEIYEVQGKEYFQITGWQHQKIDKAQPSKYPARPFADHSPNDPRMVVEQSRIGFDGREGKGREGRPAFPAENSNSSDSGNSSKLVGYIGEDEENSRPFRVVNGGVR